MKKKKKNECEFDDWNCKKNHLSHHFPSHDTFIGNEWKMDERHFKTLNFNIFKIMMNVIFEQTENFNENLIRDIHLLAEESYYKWYMDALQSKKKIICNTKNEKHLEN